MAKKKDPSVTFLNKFGYNVVRLPRVGIEPMDIIGKDDTTQWLGPLASVWHSTIPVPTPSAPHPAAAVNGQKTDNLDLSIGLKVLANALAAFGATMPSLDVAFHRARSVQFSYSNVTSTVVAPLDAGNFLASGDLNTNNPVVQHYFLGDEAEAYLIVDVLKSDSITVNATDSSGVEVGVDVPAISATVGAKVGVKSNNASNSSITFKGAVPVTFGFIVDEIHFDGTKWQLTGSAPSGLTALGVSAGGGAGAAPAMAPQPIMLGTACRVNLR